MRRGKSGIQQTPAQSPKPPAQGKTCWLSAGNKKWNDPEMNHPTGGSSGNPLPGSFNQPSVSWSFPSYRSIKKAGARHRPGTQLKLLRRDDRAVLEAARHQLVGLSWSAFYRRTHFHVVAPKLSLAPLIFVKVQPLGLNFKRHYDSKRPPSESFPEVGPLQTL